MSSWKKASKVNQKVHRERHQPADRSHLGLLEKHKDYVHRAKDYQKKQRTLKKLKEHALNKNPDEYYHHMVNSHLVDGKHREKTKPPTEDTLEQKKIMENNNLSYVRMKLNMEQKKVNKLLSQLHLIDNPTNEHASNKLSVQLLEQPKLIPDKKAVYKVQKLKEQSYKKLAKSIQRMKQLEVIKDKMEVQINLSKTKNSSRPKLITPASKTKAPIYEWKYERKR